jgi:hypothetical protein
LGKKAPVQLAYSIGTRVNLRHRHRRKHPTNRRPNVGRTKSPSQSALPSSSFRIGHSFKQRSAAWALTYIKRVEASRPALSERHVKALDQDQEPPAPGDGSGDRVRSWQKQKSSGSTEMTAHDPLRTCRPAF